MCQIKPKLHGRWKPHPHTEQGVKIIAVTLRVHLASPSSGGQGGVAATSKPDESGAKL